MHRMTIRQAEFEVRTPKESQKKFVRSRKLSESEAKDRVDGAETFLSEDWPNAEKDRELIDAMREREREELESEFWRIIFQHGKWIFMVDKKMRRREKIRIFSGK